MVVINYIEKAGFEEAARLNVNSNGVLSAGIVIGQDFNQCKVTATLPCVSKGIAQNGII